MRMLQRGIGMLVTGTEKHPVSANRKRKFSLLSFSEDKCIKNEYREGEILNSGEKNPQDLTVHFFLPAGKVTSGEKPADSVLPPPVFLHYFFSSYSLNCE